MKRPSSGGDATQHTLIHSEGCGVPNYLPGHTGAKWSHMLVISTKETLSSHLKKKKKKMHYLNKSRISWNRSAIPGESARDKDNGKRKWNTTRWRDYHPEQLRCEGKFYVRFLQAALRTLQLLSCVCVCVRFIFSI